MNVLITLLKALVKFEIVIVAALPMSNCQLCDRDCLKLTVHHLIPRQQVKRKKLDESPTANLCAACHRQIHALFSNQSLATEFNTINLLQEHPQMQTFLTWIRKQDPNRKIRTRKAK